MDWLKKCYDRVLLLLAALLLIGLSAFLYLSATTFAEQFNDRNSSKPPDNEIPPASTEPLQSAQTSLAKPKTWRTHEASLFVSRPYILKTETVEGTEREILIDPLQGDKNLHPPVPNKWLMDNNLDYTLIDVLKSDPDSDAFTVLEEWQAGTNPTDKNDIPPYWTKLRLKEFIRIPFRVKFNGTPDGGETFSINSIDDPRKPTQFLKIGDIFLVAGAPHKLTQYTQKSKDDKGIDLDVSELTLENVATKENIILISKQVINSPSSFALFVNLLDGSEMRVKKGDEFALIQAPELKYKLVDISEENALIEDRKTGNKHTVPSLGSDKH